MEWDQELANQRADDDGWKCQPDPEVAALERATRKARLAAKLVACDTKTSPIIATRPNTAYRELREYFSAGNPARSGRSGVARRPDNSSLDGSSKECPKPNVWTRYARRLKRLWYAVMLGIHLVSAPIAIQEVWFYVEKSREYIPIPFSSPHEATSVQI